MPSTDSHAHHAIDYIELYVTDLTAAKRFYSAAFGWTFNDYGPDYSGILGTTREQGGLCRVDDAVSTEAGTPLVVLYSCDLDATLGAVKEAGGHVVRDPFVFPGGRRFHFRDPSGNVLGVWGEPSEAPGPAAG